MTTGSHRKQAYRQSNTGYPKSAATRKAILRAAIEAFGRAGYGGTTTRQIAAAAGVNQPSINYHFGGKDGLYQACADEILANFTGPLAEVSQRAFRAAKSSLGRKDAAAQLKELLSALADVMILSKEVSQAAGFVGREMREPGLAYQTLYSNLWSPGIELAAHLIGAAKGRSHADATDRIDAIMMVSGIAAFVPGLPVSMEIMNWQVAGEEGKSLVLERLAAQIDGWVKSSDRALNHQNKPDLDAISQSC